MDKRQTIIQMFSDLLKKLPVLFVLILLFSCTYTTQIKAPTDRSVFEHWKKAVINIEGAADKTPAIELAQRWGDLVDKFQKGKITEEEFLRERDGLSVGMRSIRSTGTAIFLEHEGHNYLITTRHVLYDEYSAKKSVKAAEESGDKVYIQFEKEWAKNQIFPMIFRVPTLDEVSGKQKRGQEFLMNLQSGPPELWPYTFSEPEIDLAIVSLDQRNSRFVKELKALGYQPIHLNDISDMPSAEGAEVFTVGYPGFSYFNLFLPEKAPWSSVFASVPSFAFGKVSMLHNELRYFFCDMSIYPGNSGGPVVENNKIVGIVSHQFRLPVERVINSKSSQEKELLYRIPFGIMIKAQYLKPLIKEQMQKDLKSPFRMR